MEKEKLPELKAINREIRAGQRKVKLLKLEAEQIARDIQLLRRLKRDLVQSVNQTNQVYKNLQTEIREMVDFIPLLNEQEKEEIFRNRP